MKTSTQCLTSDNLDPIPPLSQSRYSDMGCETLYVRKHVQCARIAESEPAARGIEIHQILSSYINHLVRARRATDLEVFDALMRGAGAEAREVLERFRDNHAFDPEKILATELHIALDESFLPVEQVCDDGPIADYEGTLDLVMLHSLTEAEIDDWKSYYQVIDADTFQSKFYPLLLMCLNPSLERVKFVLEFVRYGVSRCSSEHWANFLRNHAKAIAACDFVVAVTARFIILYIIVVMKVGSRKLLHVTVTLHPTSAWTFQRHQEAIPSGYHNYRKGHADSRREAGYDATSVL